MSARTAFIHAWVLPAEIERTVWDALHQDVVRVIRIASAELESTRRSDELAQLRGPNGFGPLVIRPDIIAFNGNAFLGQAGDAFSLERVATSGIISRHATNGSRRAVHRCDTAGHAYDLAVCAALVVVAHHLGSDARVGTSGTLRTGWSRAAAVFRAATATSGQLVQQENGVLRWIPDVMSSGRPSRSSA